MRERGWGRIVNVSSGIAAHPETMIGGNSYATTKAALEAHTVNLAAELAGTGVTVNIYRPGIVDTAMQTWIRSQDPARIGEQLHARFVVIRIRERCSPQRSLVVHWLHTCPAQRMDRSGMSRTSFRHNFHMA